MEGTIILVGLMIGSIGFLIGSVLTEPTRLKDKPACIVFHSETYCKESK